MVHNVFVSHLLKCTTISKIDIFFILLQMGKFVKIMALSHSGHLVSRYIIYIFESLREIKMKSNNINFVCSSHG